MKIELRKFRIFISQPFCRDFETGKIMFWKPKFRFINYKNRPCITRWLYRWILIFGYVSIYKHAGDKQ